MSIVLSGDFNACVGDEVVEDVVGRHGVLGRNENGKRMIVLYVERDGGWQNVLQEEGYSQEYMGEIRQWKGYG